MHCSSINLLQFIVLDTNILCRLSIDLSIDHVGIYIDQLPDVQLLAMYLEDTQECWHTVLLY